jgi:3-deoxy-D-manno-octulosonic-acid transferase
MGEMGLWLRLAPVSFVGGSIAPLGGHNPFEAAALGSAILHGPATANFGPAYRALDATGGARTVADGAGMGRVLVKLMEDEAARAAIARAARAVRADLAPEVARLAREALDLMDGAA